MSLKNDINFSTSTQQSKEKLQKIDPEAFQACSNIKSINKHGVRLDLQPYTSSSRRGQPLYITAGCEEEMYNGVSFPLSYILDNQERLGFVVEYEEPGK